MKFVKTLDCLRSNKMSSVYLTMSRKKFTCHLHLLKSILMWVDNEEQTTKILFLTSVLLIFQIYGSRNSSSTSSKVFNWSHSYSKIFPHLRSTSYDPYGAYLQFSSFDVENRPRVKCVSAQYGVPVSTQWDKAGYYYATQICQYALSHWSKALINTEENILLLENGNQTFSEAYWTGNVINRVTNDKCVHFDQPMTLHLSGAKVMGLLVISFDLLVRDRPTIIVEVSNPDKGKYTLRYTSEAADFLTRSARSITFGFGQNDRQPIVEGTWKSFTRNLANDLMKGVPFDHHSKALKQVWTVESIAVMGVGCITNISLAKSRHQRMFFHAADWLLAAQDQKSGGWPVNARFNLKKSKYPFAKEIPPGWLSAMGSSHAMSVLIRAYHKSSEDKYLKAAIKALQPFSLSSKEGGFKAVFMNTYVWYEEYPTSPDSFVLNGFMYSLLGLYDLWKTLEHLDDEKNEHRKMLGSTGQKAKWLFGNGTRSLVAMLPFYDTGSGSTYDLRHFTMGGPPKLARWDYHSTHVNLMFVLSTVVENEADKETILEIAGRWQRYMIGQRADHN